MSECCANCNLSQSGARARFYLGVVGLLCTLGGVFFCISFGVSVLWLFPLVYLTTLGFLQSFYKYCVAIGISRIVKNFQFEKEEVIQILKINSIAAVVALLVVCGLWVVFK